MRTMTFEELFWRPIYVWEALRRSIDLPGGGCSHMGILAMDFDKKLENLAPFFVPQ
jgi:hypothetical protein